MPEHSETMPMERCLIPACGLEREHDGPHRIIEGLDHWRPVAGKKRCRMMGRNHSECRREAVVEINRGHRTKDGTRDSWWAYCDEHSYGRRVDGGRVIREWFTSDQLGGDG